MYFLLSRTMETLQKTNSTILFHFLIHAYSARTLYLLFIDESEWAVRNKNCRLSCFLLCHHFQCKSLAKTGKQHERYMIRVPYSSMFLWKPLPSFCVWSKFWFEWKVWPFWAISASICSVVNVTNTLPSMASGVAELPHIVDPSEVCAHGAWQALHLNSLARNGRHAYWAYRLCSHTCSFVSLDFMYETQVQR